MTDYDDTLIELEEDTLDLSQEEMVANYLRKHPDFLLKQQDILADIYLPHPTGSAVSLVEKQVSILRQRQITLRGQLNQLIATAKENDKLFNLTKALVLKIVSAPDLDSIDEALRQGFSTDFSVDESTLILFEEHVQQQNFNGRITNRETTYDTIGSLLDTSQTVRGIMRPKELNFLFPHAEQVIESAAIISIKKGTDIIGALAIGSKDQHRYNHAMGTVFLDFIGAATSIRLGQLLTHSH